jgi:hypothetical protein
MICKACKQEKSFRDFYPKRKSRCKSCLQAEQRARMNRNRRAMGIQPIAEKKRAIMSRNGLVCEMWVSNPQMSTKQIAHHFKIHPVTVQEIITNYLPPTGDTIIILKQSKVENLASDSVE